MLDSQFYRSCSWCHNQTPIDSGGGYCPVCYHRADLPRDQCTCSRCQVARNSFPEAVWRAMLEDWRGQCQRP